MQPDSKADVASVLPSIRLNEPVPHAALNIESAEAAFQRVLENAGATLPKRDAVDQRVIESVRTGRVADTRIAPSSKGKARFFGFAEQWVDELEAGVKLGYITDPTEVGGYPDYKGEPYADADSDGLPDDWEKKHNLDPHDASDAVSDTDGNGYSNIEEFINSTQSPPAAGR